MKGNKFINTTNKRIGQTIFQQKLIEPGDRVLVALSGGKDSLILLESLAERKRVLKFNFDIVAVHIFISNIGYKTDKEFLREVCKK